MTRRFVVSIADVKGQLIPSGVAEALSVEVGSGWASFHFNDIKTTRRFAVVAVELERKGLEPGCHTLFFERLNKFVTRYDGLDEEAVYERLMRDFRLLGGEKQ